MPKQPKSKIKSKKMKLTLKRSIIGVPPKHKACVRTLGLRKINHSVEVTATPSITGVIHTVNYLLLVEEV